MRQAKRTKWRRLENAAKISPATSNKKDERVFRMACELTQDVQPAALQTALDETMEDFALFRCVLRKGLFWNYFEQSALCPVVREEYKAPCSRLYNPNRKQLLFEVTYYRRRINVEIFHALADGTGTARFLKAIVYRYLMLTHPAEVSGPLTRLNIDGTDTEKSEDSFTKYYSKDKAAEPIPKYRAYQLPKPLLENGEMQIFEGVASTAALRGLAKQHNTTITVFLASVLLCAVAKDMSTRDKQRPVALMIPVNLRKMFPSESVRNFFGWIDLGYDFGKNSEALADVVQYTAAFFAREITPPRMATRMNGLVKLERNGLMRLVPLEIKALFMQLGNYASRHADTAVFSNIGVITMPEECAPFIRLFDFFTSTGKMELCSCSYADNLVMAFTTAYESTNIYRNFFCMLTQLGVQINVAARIPQEETNENV